MGIFMEDLIHYSKEELVDMVKQGRSEVDLLQGINQALKGDFHLESLLREILNRTRESLDSEACSLFLLNERRELFFYVTDDKSPDLSGVYLKKGQGIVGHVVESCESLIVNDVNLSPHFFSGLDNETGFITRSVLCAPLNVEGRVIGALEVLNKQNGLYDERDKKLLEMVCSQCATLCDRDELIKIIKRRQREVDLLLEANQSLQGHFQLEPLLREILHETKRFLNSEASSLFLLNEEGELFFYVTDDSGKNLSEIYLRKGQGIVGSVVESGQPVIVNDARNDHRFFSGVDNKTGFVTRSLICVPMKIEGQILGAVEVLNKSEGVFQQEDLRLLELISSQAALAIQYVRSNEKRTQSERMALVGSMSAAIIHDLRNSMQIIGGYNQLIAMKSPESAKYCTIITNEIDKFISMVREILEFSRGGTQELNRRDLSIHLFLQRVAEINREQFQRADVEFSLQLADDGQINIDEEKMLRVLQNILNNGCDALEGLKERKISMSGGFFKGIPVITITDSGKGMDEETKRNVFKPFFSKGKKGGTGLGMAIVKSIVDAHGGEITLESEQGKGSTFRIVLG
jgi:signal transduction histidine kinase